MKIHFWLSGEKTKRNLTSLSISNLPPFSRSRVEREAHTMSGPVKKLAVRERQLLPTPPSGAVVPSPSLRL
jgi:hypothetical protein